MCVVSMIGDHYSDKWGDWKDRFPKQWPIEPHTPFAPIPEITRSEFDKLKEQVDEMVKLLKRAQEYDKANNEPDCELEDKMKVLRQVAKLVGVDLDTVLKGA